MKAKQPPPSLPDKFRAGGKALGYLQNARAILKKAPRQGPVYTNVKFVQEACGTAYLAVLKALDEYLLNRGLTQKELPESFEQYQKAIRKHLAIHNGKLFRQFDYLYDTLHLAGYYRGLLHQVEIVREALNATQSFIEKIK
jgi:hypothetical protein